MSDESTDVVAVDVERSTGVTITFADGAECEFDVSRLRAACPCATCRALRERGEQVWPRNDRASAIEIRDASFVGAWGLSITWSDGHDTGIYAWAALRRWFDDGFTGVLTVEA